jgi:hypothetical protein
MTLTTTTTQQYVVVVVKVIDKGPVLLSGCGG